MKPCIARLLRNTASDVSFQTLRERARIISVELREDGEDEEDIVSTLEEWAANRGCDERNVRSISELARWAFGKGFRLSCSKKGTLVARGYCTHPNGGCGWLARRTTKQFRESGFDEMGWPEHLHRKTKMGYMATETYRIIRDREIEQGAPVAIGIRAIASELRRRSKAFTQKPLPTEVCRAIAVLKRVGLLCQVRSGKPGPDSGLANVYQRILPIPVLPEG